MHLSTEDFKTMVDNLTCLKTEKDITCFMGLELVKRLL